ncbi:MAG: virulence associated protein [Chloroflexi bacterium RBG_13_51_36]|nr:MAG: virulence associated protein [Chloroflexi bacterium RBG_13_51_36]
MRQVTAPSYSVSERLPRHLNWLIDAEQRLKTVDHKIVSVLELRHQRDSKVLSEWAEHFRNHYCSDVDIDTLRKGTSYTRAAFLREIKFPDKSKKPGPSIRAGDFSEILVADYVQYMLKYWVPRNRYCDKKNRNESPKGSDILGFKIVRQGQESERDVLAIYEVKSRLSGTKAYNRLQEAVTDSCKDVRRRAESLNAVKQHLLDKKQETYIPLVERFQNPIDHPYKDAWGAVALFSTGCFSGDLICETDASMHPGKDNLTLIVIHGRDMMKLVHALYRRAANEA